MIHLVKLASMVLSVIGIGLGIGVVGFVLLLAQAFDGDDE
jgi:hypothetical protein